MEKNDDPALSAIFGPEGDDIIHTGEPARDKKNAADFLVKAHEKKEIVTDPKAPGRAVLVIGNEDWPFPVPIVKNGKNEWFFDSKAGLQEILYRRIGGNELDAIQICLGYVQAQDDYAVKKRADNGVAEYAQRIISEPGKQNGLAWRNADGTWGGPIGERIADVIEQGYAKGDPYHGYFFKSIEGPGPGRTARPHGLRREGRDDRRLRARRGARRVSSDRRQDVHREQRRRGLRKGPRTEHARGVPQHGALRSGPDVASGGFVAGGRARRRATPSLEEKTARGFAYARVGESVDVAVEQVVNEAGGEAERDQRRHPGGRPQSDRKGSEEPVPVVHPPCRFASTSKNGSRTVDESTSRSTRAHGRTFTACSEGRSAPRSGAGSAPGVREARPVASTQCCDVQSTRNRKGLREQSASATMTARPRM